MRAPSFWTISSLFLLQISSLSATFSLEREAAAIESCGRKQVVTMTEVLQNLLVGIADEYFDKSYFQTIEKLEEKKYTGEYQDYWETGQLRTRINFVDGIPDGHFHGWYPNGSDAYKGHLEMGRKQGIHIAFYLSEVVNKETSPCARILKYDNSGNLHGKQESMHSRGVLKATMEMYQGQKNGKLNLYKPNGELYRSKEFINGIDISN